MRWEDFWHPPTSQRTYEITTSHHDKATFLELREREVWQKQLLPPNTVEFQNLILHIRS